ncbi:LysM peptidoglycan-binding domain-containing protein, partial [Chloroflexota bacterium]
MFKRIWVKFMVLLLVVLALGGCFRQASPDLQLPVNNDVPTTMPTSSPTDLPTEAPFITPFPTGEGLDPNQLPPLADPSATLALVEPGVTNAAPGSNIGGDDAGILPVDPQVPAAPATIPFAAGPTYTPRPGEPPVDLNPNAPPTPGGDQSGAAADAPDLGEECIYVVQPGDSAFYITTLYNISLVELTEANDLESPDRLYQGQELKIPNCGQDLPSPPDQPAAPTAVIGVVDATPTSILPPPIDAAGNAVHVVQPGENLFRISIQYGVSVEQIVVANGLPSA